MKVPSKNQVIAAVYELQEDAAATISDVHRSRGDLRERSGVSLGQRTGGHSFGYSDGGNRMIYWGEESEFWDDLWGMLHGSAFYFVPGFGSLLIGGPIFVSILEALEVGLSGGVSERSGETSHKEGVTGEKVEVYETAIQRGCCMVIADTGSGDTSNVGEIIASSAPLFRGDYPAEVLRSCSSSSVAPREREEASTSSWPLSSP